MSDSVDLGWLTAWMAGQWRELPKTRTPQAHGKAELLRELTDDLDRHLGLLDDEPIEGCPDCGCDTVEDHGDETSCVTCGWRP